MSLAKLAVAVTYLAAVELRPGERFTIDRYGKSVTWDAAAVNLPSRIRAHLEIEADRRRFADDVFDSFRRPSPGLPRAELADGILALPPNFRLHVTRLASAHPISIGWRMERVGEAHREATSFGGQITPEMVESVLGSLIKELS